MTPVEEGGSRTKDESCGSLHLRRCPVGVVVRSSTLLRQKYLKSNKSLFIKFFIDLLEKDFSVFKRTFNSQDGCVKGVPVFGW